MDSSIKLFADDCIIYTKIICKNDIEKLGGVGGRKLGENKSR